MINGRCLEVRDCLGHVDSCLTTASFGNADATAIAITCCYLSERVRFLPDAALACSLGPLLALPPQLLIGGEAGVALLAPGWYLGAACAAALRYTETAVVVRRPLASL